MVMTNHEAILEKEMSKMTEEIEWKVQIKKELAKKELIKNKISPRTFDYRTK